jgi:ketosteroid isomerase-like protein
MKTCLVVALVGLAIGFTVPTFAQQKDTVDPQKIQQYAALGKKYAEAVNNNDAAAVAALYTEDAVRMTATGPIYGRAAINIGQTCSRKCISATISPSSMPLTL